MEYNTPELKLVKTLKDRVWHAKDLKDISQESFDKILLALLHLQEELK